jgi:transposase-like protein
MVYRLAEPALATLVEERNEYRWVVEECPYCGKRHSRGGGLLSGNPQRYLGYKTPHCNRDDVRDPPRPENYKLLEKR